MSDNPAPVQKPRSFFEKLSEKLFHEHPETKEEFIEKLHYHLVYYFPKVSIDHISNDRLRFYNYSSFGERINFLEVINSLLLFDSLFIR